MDHEMLILTNPMTRNDHDQITLVTNLLFIMRKEFLGILLTLPILGHNPIPVHSDVDGLLHLVGHDLSNEGIARRGFIFGHGVYERGEAWDGGDVGEVVVGHGFDIFVVVVDSAGFGNVTSLLLELLLRRKGST